MKKAFYIVIISVLCTGLQSSGQFLIGPQAGINFATLKGTTLSVNTKPGFHVGGFVSIPFGDHFSLMPALLYELDKYDYSYTTTTKPTSDTTLLETADVNATLAYLDVPVLLNYFVGESRGLMIQAGLQLSVLITDHSTLSTTVSANGGNPQPGDPTNENKVSLNKSDVAFVGGLGYKFSQLVIVYARVSTGFLKAVDGSFINDADRGHTFSFETGLALSFGAK